MHKCGRIAASDQLLRRNTTRTSRRAVRGSVADGQDQICERTYQKRHTDEQRVDALQAPSLGSTERTPSRANDPDRDPEEQRRPEGDHAHVSIEKRPIVR
jgi:hypothetical protein